ncbi:hypothetical protein, partial [Acidithiobacillus sp.]
MGCPSPGIVSVLCHPGLRSSRYDGAGGGGDDEEQRRREVDYRRPEHHAAVQRRRERSPNGIRYYSRNYSSFTRGCWSCCAHGDTLAAWVHSG